GGGDTDAHAGEPLAQTMERDQPAHEGEAPGLAAERAAADAVEIAPEVEGGAVEVRHHRLAALETVVGEGLDEIGPQRFRVIVVIRQLAGAQGMGEGELGARLEPAGEVVPLAVVEQ